MRDKNIRILFVDDDPVTGQVMQRHCQGIGYSCEVYQSPRKCLDEFSRGGADVVVTDLRMPEMTGFEVLNEIRSIDPEVPVLVMTGYSSVENAVEAMKRGASDFIKKPFDFEELKLMIDRAIRSQRLRDENEMLRQQLHKPDVQYGMIGDTPVMKELFSTIRKVAEVSCNVIITGESGTGKELIARALHDYSPRKDMPFVIVDCGALTETLLETELFGHEKGAFTGASYRKKGLMERASGGTLFLDEISNISDAMQMKLMRAIEDQKLTRVGGTEQTAIDLRIIAATNRDLETMVNQGEFRHDFYHRLNVVNIKAPPLSERKQDIPALVNYFVTDFARRYNRDVKGFDQHSLNRMCEAHWQGNIRELRNAVERCVILAEKPVLHWASPPGPAMAVSAAPGAISIAPGDDFVPLKDLERDYITRVLKHAAGRKTEAARILGIDKTTLWRKLRRYELDEA